MQGLFTFLLRAAAALLLIKISGDSNQDFFLRIQRRHVEQVKVILPVILGVLNVASSENDEEETKSINDLLSAAVSIGSSIQEICQKLFSPVTITQGKTKGSRRKRSKQKPMLRSRGSEMSQQRQSPRAPLHLKPPKLESKSPRSPLHERKKGSRVADLETKLGHAQEELEKLKEQLASAEAARIDALKELEETKKQFPASPLKCAAIDPVDEEKEKSIKMEEEKFDPGEVLMEKHESLPAPTEEDSVNCPTTDVFEVAPASCQGEGSRLEEEKCKEEMGAVEKETEEEEAVEIPKITELRAILAEKENQFVTVLAKNKSLIQETNNAKADSSEWREKADEMATKLAQADEELNKTKMTVEHLRDKLQLEETGKTSMEAEMKRLRVQTEQWRKAAEAAASVLVAGDGFVNDGELNGRRLGESGRSMEKHLRGYDVSMRGGGWSPVIAGADVAEGNGGGKRRTSGGGIPVFGELWKKKGQLK